MAEPKIEVVAAENTEVPAEETSRLASFRLNHPRTAKVVGIAALTAATLGAVQIWKTRRQAALEAEAQASPDDSPFEITSEIA